jgi:hypothetical protein
LLLWSVPASWVLTGSRQKLPEEASWKWREALPVSFTFIILLTSVKAEAETRGVSEQ